VTTILMVNAPGGPPDVTINHAHGGREGRAASIGTEAEIDRAIRQDLSSNPPTSTGPQPERTIKVNGKDLVYRPFVRPDNTINVGTYFPK
jgi:hypothetical protein